MNRTLFIGTFLSHIKGTKSVAEKISSLLEKDFNFKLVSHQSGKFLRIIDIVFHVLFIAYEKIHIDVFSGQAFIIAEIASWISLKRNKKIILTLRGGKLPEFARANRRRIEEVFKRAWHIQTPSRYLQAFFIHYGYDIHYLPNPIDLEWFPFIPNTQNSHKLLWVRAFSSIYNPELAVQTLHEVHRTHPQATLTLIGPDKGELDKVKGLISELKLEDKIWITGSIPNEELFKFYHSHNVYLNTTSYESFGVAVMEAAACGIPIVSTRVGEIPFLWENEKDILMVDKIDAELFAIQINRLFADDAFAKKLTINARKKAEQFDWKIIKPKWIKLISWYGIA